MEEDIETCGWFVFYKDQLLIEKKNGMYTIPFGTHCQDFLRTCPGARQRK